MSRIRLLSVLAAGLMSCSLSHTQAAAPTQQRGRGMAVPPPAPRIIIGKRDGLHAQMIKKFDTNGDGRLNEKEKEAAKAAAQSNPKISGKK